MIAASARTSRDDPHRQAPQTSHEKTVLPRGICSVDGEAAWRSVEKTLDGHPAFEPCQRRSHAQVKALSESHVCTPRGAVQVDLVAAGVEVY